MAQKILRWWPVLLVIASAALAWGTLSTRVERNESDIHEIREDMDMVREAIPKIQTDIEWIRKALED